MVTKIGAGGRKAPLICFFFVYASHNNNPKRAKFPPIFLPHFDTLTIGGSFVSPFFLSMWIGHYHKQGEQNLLLFSWLFSSH
jgi:hypothetical protein